MVWRTSPPGIARAQMYDHFNLKAGPSHLPFKMSHARLGGLSAIQRLWLGVINRKTEVVKRRAAEMTAEEFGTDLRRRVRSKLTSHSDALVEPDDDDEAVADDDDEADPEAVADDDGLNAPFGADPPSPTTIADDFAIVMGGSPAPEESHLWN